jgi:hypothetical protein
MSVAFGSRNSSSGALHFAEFHTTTTPVKKSHRIDTPKIFGAYNPMLAHWRVDPHR